MTCRPNPVLGLPLLAVLACESVPEPAAGTVPEGVDVRHAEVVVHRTLGEVPVWTIDDNPSLSIGAEDRPGPELFGRLAGIARGPGGLIVVADAQAFELRAFDMAGAHRWTAGRRGGGPGEFERLSAPAVFLDSVLTVDPSTGRAQVFARSGDFVRSFRLPSAGPDVSSVRMLHGAFDDGGIVVTAPLNRPQAEIGYQRQVRALLICDAAGDRCSQVGAFPASEFVVRELPGGGFVGQAVVMGRETVYAVDGNRLVVAPQDRFEVFLFKAQGVLERIIRVAHAPVPVDARVRERYVQVGLQGVTDPERRAYVRAQREAALLPDTLPVLGQVLLDADGRLWVQEIALPLDAREPAWWIFDWSGALVAQARMPPAFRPYHIDESTALGVFTDPLGVAYVQVREVVRPR